MVSYLAFNRYYSIVIVVTSVETPYNLGIPNVMLTVVGELRSFIVTQLAQVNILYSGVVIGFVIAYRASSGYDRYWMGRCGWSDVAKNCRVLGRLIWIHVPLRVIPASQDKRTDLAAILDDEKRVLEEKRIALFLIEG